MNNEDRAPYASSLSVTVTLHEPYRITTDELKDRNYARWGKWRGDPAIKVPYIPGTTLWTAVKRAAEDLISRNVNRWGGEQGCCCPGDGDGSDDRGNQASYTLRANGKDLCNLDSPESFCPLCLLQNRRREEDGPVHVWFDKLTLKLETSPVDLKYARRATNRVDQTTGKAADAFVFDEIIDVRDEYRTFRGEILYVNKSVGGKSVRDLIIDAGSLVNTLVGSLCTISIDEERNEFKKREVSFKRMQELGRELKERRENVNEEVSDRCEPGATERPDPDIAAKAEKIFEAFKNQGKPDKIQEVAQVMLRLTSKERAYIEKLPKDWGVEVNKQPLKTLLLVYAKEVENKRSWGPFWKGLAEALKTSYVKETGNTRAVASSFHAPDCLSLNTLNRHVTSVPLNAEEPWFEWHICGTLTARTPFFLSGGRKEGAAIDYEMLLGENENGELCYRLPRSTLRGILARDIHAATGGAGCSRDLDRTSGQCMCRVCMIMRNVKIMDTLSGGAFVKPEIRERIRMNPYTGTVIDTGLFNGQFGPKDTTFPFHLVYRGSHLPEALRSVLAYWKEGKAWIGGLNGTGKGRFKLDISQVYKFDLKSDFDTYKSSACVGLYGKTAAGVGNGQELFAAELLNHASLNAYKQFLKPQWEKVEYEIHFASPLISGDPIAALFEGEGHDLVSYYQAGPDGEGRTYLLKSETIRGIMRTAFGKLKGKLGGLHEDCGEECEICTAFGNEHANGKLRFEDLTLLNELEVGTKVKVIDNVSIDRFKSGAKDTAKYDKVVIAASPDRPAKFRGILWIHRDLMDEKHQRDIINTFVAIRDGLFPIGGDSGTGYGWVGKVIVREGNDKLKKEFSEEWRKLEPALLPNVDDAATNKSIVRERIEGLSKGSVYYPYYFVPFGKELVGDSRTKQAIGHEKFRDKVTTKDGFGNEKTEDSISGIISCTFETLTPLIVPDTGNNVIEKPSGHKEYQFFNIDGKQMIPGSGIRGPVSAVFETLTDSCLRSFEEETFLSWRMKAGDAKYCQPGMIVENDGGIGVAKMEAYSVPLYAFKANHRWGRVADANRSYLQGLLKKKGSNEPLKYLMSVRVSFEIVPSSGGKGRYAKLTDKPSNGQQLKHGHLMITGPNTTKTKNKSLGYDAPDSNWDRGKINIAHNRGRMVAFEIAGVSYEIDKIHEQVFVAVDEGDFLPITVKATRQLKELITEAVKNRSRAYQAVNKVVADNFTTYFRHEDGLLHVNDLVWYIEVDGQADTIIPVRISRVFAEKPLAQMLLSSNQHLRPCARTFIEDEDKSKRPGDQLFYMSPDGLCPACHLFGTANYKSRVRFGFATLEGNPKFIEGDSRIKNGKLALDLLESPRPTWVLNPPGEDQLPIPGRKFYVHHHGWKRIMDRQWDDSKGAQEQPKDVIKKGPNNCTVETLASGNRFRFRVYFENLRHWELGLLLYSLQLEPDLAHKIGKGKPQGFGSVRINVGDLRKLIVSGHHSGHKWESATNEEIEGYLDEGWKKLTEWFSSNVNGTPGGYAHWRKMSDSFISSSHISKLKKLLTYHENANIDVRYPSLEGREEEPGYSYKELGDLPRKARQEYLKDPWHAMLPMAKGEVTRWADPLQENGKWTSKGYGKLKVDGHEYSFKEPKAGAFNGLSKGDVVGLYVFEGKPYCVTLAAQ